MFNRTYQLRAVKKAGGGRKLAYDAGLCLPWAGIFQPREPWRPLVMIAAAAEEVAADKTFHRPNPAVRREIAANRCKKRSQRLQGTQLELFPEKGDPNFYRPAMPTSVRTFAYDPERPLADVFTEAYTT
jgi:hypothetical protein